ncbi:hypothetical protein GALMADRAFT_1249602 [Galerina marginata CBS 339.88]|uniref:Uncharacterized protein n=1 Tax=Galerina marginata (strain CBS 339.88) TaxID=685588 RepID=A0A067T5N5_GALM3|nr:hypothetical protein GALMADRAFT_1249602 [Galerina marginata CBS 339.88]
MVPSSSIDTIIQDTTEVELSIRTSFTIIQNIIPPSYAAEPKFYLRPRQVYLNRASELISLTYSSDKPSLYRGRASRSKYLARESRKGRKLSVYVQEKKGVIYGHGGISEVICFEVLEDAVRFEGRYCFKAVISGVRPGHCTVSSQRSRLTGGLIIS